MIILVVIKVEVIKYHEKRSLRDNILMVRVTYHYHNL